MDFNTKKGKGNIYYFPINPFMPFQWLLKPGHIPLLRLDLKNLRLLKHGYEVLIFSFKISFLKILVMHLNFSEKIIYV